MNAVSATDILNPPVNMSIDGGVWGAAAPTPVWVSIWTPRAPNLAMATSSRVLTGESELRNDAGMLSFVGMDN